MRRRWFITLPGITAAFAASRAFGQIREKLSDASAPDAAVAPVSSKALTKHVGSKSAYKIPKSGAKQAKYLRSVTALLSLTAAQQQQVAAIYTNAGNTRASVRSDLKTARKSLSEAVKNNDSGGISKAAMVLGTLMSQHFANGALANAAFYQLLTPDQKAKLSQFKS